MLKTVVRLAPVVVWLALSVPGLHGQTPATGRVMRMKLTHSQRILEAILVSNFSLLERESAELARATQLPGWSVLNSPEYRKQSVAFLEATRNLIEAAKQRDLDAAAGHYTALVTTCYQCHRHMKNSRIAGSR